VVRWDTERSVARGAMYTMRGGGGCIYSDVAWFLGGDACSRRGPNANLGGRGGAHPLRSVVSVGGGGDRAVGVGRVWCREVDLFVERLFAHEGGCRECGAVAHYEGRSWADLPRLRGLAEGVDSRLSCWLRGWFGVRTWSCRSQR